MADAPDRFGYESDDDTRDGEVEELREDRIEGQEESRHPIRHDEPEADTQGDRYDDAGEQTEA